MGPVDASTLARVARGALLSVRRLAPGVYEVAGGEQAHEVRLTQIGEDCDCADRAYRQVRCAHLWAVSLRRGEPEAWEALGVLIRSAGLDRPVARKALAR